MHLDVFNMLCEHLCYYSETQLDLGETPRFHGAPPQKRVDGWVGEPFTTSPYAFMFGETTCSTICCCYKAVVLYELICQAAIRVEGNMIFKSSRVSCAVRSNCTLGVALHGT